MLINLLGGLEAEGSLMGTISVVSRWRELGTFSLVHVSQAYINITQPLQQAGAMAQVVMLEAKHTPEK